MKGKVKKEPYEKPEIESEDVEIIAYGQYEAMPISQLNPFFGLCPPCPEG